MKKIWLLILLLLIPLALATNIYQQDSLELELQIEGEFTLVKENSAASLSSISAELLLLPEESFRQQIVGLTNDGELTTNSITYEWTDKKIETKQFGYIADILTNNKRLEVKQPLPFPITDVQGQEQYLEPTKTIDSDHPLIIAKASELAEGETELFQTVFNLASWVEETVEYDLNTLTETSSQKASWVLQSKSGVCDEISTLFIAMARSLGIPARFASGISYTTSELFDENWQPHGWAEVYFPDVGWVSFDLTFNEYGYVDVTHIKLRDGFDPAEPATKYEWLANNVGLETSQLDLNVIIKNQGNFVPEEILLEQEILSSTVGFGSYNLIRGILKNTADYYVATTLQLTTPKEVETQGRNKRILLLAPKQIKETYWIVKVSENLDSNYEYTFPSIIYTEKNISVTDSFQAVSGEKRYSESEIEDLTVVDERKTYSRKVTFDCNYPEETKQKQEIIVNCIIKNSGNTNLQELNFCLDETCKIINLPINQEDQLDITVIPEEIGWKKIKISAINELVEKKDSLEYVVLDDPLIEVGIIHPETITYGEDLEIKINLQKDSFSTPKDIIVLLNGLGMENRWEIDQLLDQEELILILEQPPISKNNQLEIAVMWKDNEDKLHSEKQEIIVKGEATNSKDKLKMIFNWFLNLFS